MVYALRDESNKIDRTARAVLKDGDLVGYVVAYLLPFLGIDFSKPRDAISLGILLVVIGVLYAHSNLIYVNPVLAALGYHLFEVEGGRRKNNRCALQKAIFGGGAGDQRRVVGELRRSREGDTWNWAQ